MNRFALAGLLLACSWWSVALAQQDAPTGATSQEDVSGASRQNAAESDASEQDSAAAEEYVLRYRFAAGETIRWKVVHIATTETRIQGNTQTSRSRSSSVKRWHVKQVDDEGRATFVHSVESVEMWQQLSDRPEVRYDSRKDSEAPPEYSRVAETVGIPLAEVTVSTDGQIVERDKDASQLDLGLGDIVMLLPPKPVKVGASWYEPAELRVYEKNGQQKRIKIRKLYTLKKVTAGLATIEIKTEVLTPINDPRVQSQLVQQLTDGTVKFDVDAGRVQSKQIDWDASVVSFNGPDSSMKYLARFTEELLSGEAHTAAQPSAGPSRR